MQFGKQKVPKSYSKGEIRAIIFYPNYGRGLFRDRMRGEGTRRDLCCAGVSPLIIFIERRKLL